MPLMLAGEQGMFHIAVGGRGAAAADRARRRTRPDGRFRSTRATLACVWSGGQKVVMFFEGTAEGLDEDERSSRVASIVTTDPMQLTLGNIANRALFRRCR